MGIESVKELVSQFEHSDIREMNVAVEGLSLYLSKNEVNHPNENQMLSKVLKEETIDSVEEIKLVSERENTTDIENESLDGKIITSPIVGVIYTSSKPGAPPFVSVGESVSVGDTLCIIEAMKIMNDVVSDTSGTVTEIFVENEQIVEFGQPLFRIS
ncbi:acetyl-CoA carboxylase biotin carboxyl carrier protein [Vagococcus luciliae]|uniref:Biotin carboxyl carrier protein of acetyl-CoA carboxylase n=1 Tax=Vagococcus luciliae TaxID=2920380 RepID=A0ABY5P0M7_9ENTE|nr:acetyl-CoA carboxylase biotin carboxyl carrier protein [Vagococcus luciliae]UUV99188.1 Biotin carboxyl carrier protein of acetyl-CoA carboxylase [Vagococcus luciliae]